MNILNKEFIYYLISLQLYDNIESKHINTILPNVTVANGPNNLYFWEALLQLFKSDNTLSLQTVVDVYPDKTVEIEQLYQLICCGKVMYFFDINKFLFSLKPQEYTILMSYVEIDKLHTPSEWIPISNIDETDIDNVVISFDVKDTVYSPSPVNNPMLFRPISANEIIQYRVPQQVISVIPDSHPIKSSPTTPVKSTPVITSPPKPITFYDPSIIQQQQFMSQHSSCQEHRYEKPKYSWYISYIVQCAEWIQVPTCIKKYF